jgi:predicted O-methyltransferase YrrM
MQSHARRRLDIDTKETVSQLVARGRCHGQIPHLTRSGVNAMFGDSLSRHENTFLTLRQTATDRRFDMPFRKTYSYDGDYLTDRHKQLASRLHPSGMIDIGIEGWLLPADVLKLYEMAYCCGGDLLELGSYKGLSATVMNDACNDSGQSNVIVSVDLNPTAIELSRAQLHNMMGGERVHFFQDDAGAAVRNLAAIKRQFRFAFVDHSHRYDHVLDACQQLHRVVEVDGFALFHDFNDPRNIVEAETDYGVYQGVMDGLRADRWDFWGIYGCTGLFRRIGPC